VEHPDLLGRIPVCPLVGDGEAYLVRRFGGGRWGLDLDEVGDIEPSVPEKAEPRRQRQVELDATWFRPPRHANQGGGA
jgi:hypothetical protein